MTATTGAQYRADGSSLMVTKLSHLAGYTPDIISKQTALLRKAGIIITPRIRHLESPRNFSSIRQRTDSPWRTETTASSTSAGAPSAKFQPQNFRYAIGVAAMGR